MEEGVVDEGVMPKHNTTQQPHTPTPPHPHTAPTQAPDTPTTTQPNKDPPTPQPPHNHTTRQRIKHRRTGKLLRESADKILRDDEPELLVLDHHVVQLLVDCHCQVRWDRPGRRRPDCNLERGEMGG
eukprot:3632059-Rhodomonas_salina.3